MEEKTQGPPSQCQCQACKDSVCGGGGIPCPYPIDQEDLLCSHCREDIGTLLHCHSMYQRRVIFDSSKSLGLPSPVIPAGRDRFA
jgi:hypothetical protein